MKTDTCRNMLLIYYHTKSLMELNMWLRRCWLVGCSMVLPLPSSLMFETGSTRESKPILGHAANKGFWQWPLINGHDIIIQHLFLTWIQILLLSYFPHNNHLEGLQLANCMLHQHLDCNIPHNNRSLLWSIEQVEISILPKDTNSHPGHSWAQPNNIHGLVIISPVVFLLDHSMLPQEFM